MNIVKFAPDTDFTRYSKSVHYIPFVMVRRGGEAWKRRKEKGRKKLHCQSLPPDLCKYQKAVVESTSIVGTIEAMNFKKTTR